MMIVATSETTIVGSIALLVVLALGAAPDGNDPPSGPAGARGRAAAVEFNRDIRPLLSDRCYPCHGPDAAKRKAGLRLDQEGSAKADRDGRRAIVPGDRESSELVRRITARDDEERMPPPRSGKTLTPAEIERLSRWVASGAAWQAHWSFIPPKRPEVPQVPRSDWVRNPIDAFIVARLEREGLAPAAEAERGTLLRRLTLDLTGLPPSRAEIETYENDPSPDAYDKAVERVLSSPRFGERMATRWLNAARYADTNGYQTDGPRIMYRWRDWVISAYNRNLPFDRFTIEQLAGDLLPNPTLDQKIATGFNRNHRGNSEGGIIPEEYAVEYVADRVETTATVWLGLTLGCARCHSHKFDPLPQEDFYRFFAFFNNVPELGRAIKIGNSPPMIKAPTEAERERLDLLEGERSRLQSEAHATEPEIAKVQAAWEETIRRGPEFDWRPIEHDVALFGPPAEGGSWGINAECRHYFRDGEPRCTSGPVGPAFELDGRAYLDLGDRAAFGFFDKFTLSAWIRPTGQRGGTIVSRMVDEAQGEGYAVILDKGKLQVNLVKRWLDDAIRVETAAAISPDRWTHVAISYDGSRLAAGVSVYLDGKRAPTNVLLDELNQTFKTKAPLRIGAGSGAQGRFVGAICGPCVYDRALDAGDVAILATPEPVTAIASMPEAARTAGQARKIRGSFLGRAAPGPIIELMQRTETVRRQIETLNDQVATTMVMEELPVARPTFVLKRGQYDQPGVRVSPGVPGCLSPWPGAAKPDRLGLAHWLVDKANPLTARVAVNREWQMLFGTGLVRTIDDFGAQGEDPSHPELLDWLATEFVRSGWDVKALLRLMVTSATFRQSSRASSELLKRDPENRLLARGPRMRLPAEMIRDQALALGGLLVERIGGPSVKPYQPAGLWNELADAYYVQDHGPSLYRRSLYTFWKRTVPPPAMVAFDAPARESCIVRETRTNTPLQALNVLNDVTFVEAATAFAERIIKHSGPSAEARLSTAFLAATARQPRPEELAILTSGLDDHLSRFLRDPEAARVFISAGESKRDPLLDPCELAAYTAMAQLILNLDETITKE
jgi:Protein of unknown function (DUF1553)/Protein of unknown function (DUF1549)/Concanavalin A-like lectin/glucanases superfamily/Planctomycete cytochrome C